MHVICCKASTPDRVHFAVTMIMRLVKTKVWTLADVGARKLKGMDDTVSVIYYLNHVKDIKDRLLNDHIYQFGWTGTDIECVKNAFASVEAYEEKVGDGTSMAWQGNLRVAAVLGPGGQCGVRQEVQENYRAGHLLPPRS